MIDTAIVQQIYPPSGGEYGGSSDYRPLLESFGEILLQVDDKYYQGDSRVIFKRGNEYGLLIFGWGSCSGCDALQACASYEELETLRQELAEDIRWGSAEELLVYINEHDWQGDYSWSAPETHEFISKATKLLANIVAI